MIAEIVNAGPVTDLALPAMVIEVPDDYPTIQAAVDAAVDGDTILVHDGTWAGATIGEKAITVRSLNGPGSCTVNGMLYLEYGSGYLRVIDGFTVTHGDGTGIYCEGSTALINDCRVTGCIGSGIVSFYADTTITNCEIFWNTMEMFGGGGIHVWGDVTMENCLVHHNAVWDDSIGEGGGFWSTFGASTIRNCTFHSNYARVGGAIGTSQNHAVVPGGSPQPWVVTVEDCILHKNIAETAFDEIYAVGGGDVVISYSCVEAGQSETTGAVWGEGMVEADPLFVTGPGGDYYLSQTAAGQTEDSPCVDTGNPASPMIDGTTRTDLEPDIGVLDMGYHDTLSTPPAQPWLLTGPGPSVANPPMVRVFPPEQDAAHVTEFIAYGPPSYGVNVAAGDVDGDGLDEILTGAGPGAVYGPHVRGFAMDGTPLTGLSFLAYGTNRFGVNVSAGDLDGDGFDEVITGAGPGAVFGPHVRAFDYDGGPDVTPNSDVSYFAYGTPRWGVNVTAGELDGDGFDEIVTGPGPGSVYGPHVRGWNVDGGIAAPIPGVSFLAYGTNKFGVTVACGDLDGDGIAEIITAPGPSPAFGAHIRGWKYDGAGVTLMSGLDFFAWPAAEAGHGARIYAGADLDNDGSHDLVVGGGPDPALESPVNVYGYVDGTVTLLFSLQAYPESWTHGATVAAGRH